MAFSYLVRSSLPRARALISPAFMDLRKNFRMNPSLLASSGSLHNNNHHLSSTPNLCSPCPTLFRFFSDRTLNERGSEPLNKETTFGDGKRKKSDQSNKEWWEDESFIWMSVTSILFVICAKLASSGFEHGVEEKSKEGFEEFRLQLLEPGFVSKIVVDHSLAVVYLKNNTKFQSVVDQPVNKGVYLLDIKSPESFKEELEQTQKMLRLEPVPVIDVTKDYPLNSRKLALIPPIRSF